MPRPASRPVFVVVPGASQSPSHYGLLLHLLHCKGYPTMSALLPTTGTGENVTVQDDTDYVRKHMLLPVLDVENHDVILVTHSYSGVPGSAAALGLGKADRAAKGKTTSVLGQIFIAAIIAPGGDGKDIVSVCGGQLPPHIGVNEPAGLLTCDDPAPPLYGDLTDKTQQDALVLSTFCPALTSFKSPCPRASWDSKAFAGRIAFIRTTKDAAIPFEAQNMMIQGSGQEWIIKDIETGHAPQAVAPDALVEMLLELAKHFEEM